MENADHRRLLQTGDRGIGYRGDGRNAQRLPGEASLAEEVPRTENGHHGFLTVTGERGDFDLSFLNVEERIGSIALREDDFPLLRFRDASALADAGEKCLWIEVAVRTRRHGALLAVSPRLHGLSPAQTSI